MSSISGFSRSRGYYTEALRLKGSNHKDQERVEKAEKQAKEDARLHAHEAKARKGQVHLSEKSAAIEKPQSDVELGKRLDELDSKYSEVSKKLASALGNRRDKAEIKALGAKFDSFADDTSGRFDDVDSKLNDLTSQLGDQLVNVAVDLSKAITELKEVVEQSDNNNSTPLRDTVKDLKNDFNKQFTDLKAQRDFETDALLENFNEVTEQLKTLSEQSTEPTSVLEDKLGGLGGQLGTIISKLDLLGRGQNLSLRSIGRFDVAAKASNGALDKLIGIVGPNSTGDQLRSVQSRLQSVSSRFGTGQPAAELNLLA